MSTLNVIYARVADIVEEVLFAGIPIMYPGLLLGLTIYILVKLF
jgi:hypothetical protein